MRLELMTPCLKGRCSNRLSYGPVAFALKHYTIYREGPSRYATIHFMYWLRERIHITWHFTAGTLGFVAGVALALVWWVEPGLGYVVGAALLLLAMWRRRRMLIALAFTGGAFLGLARGSAATVDLAAYIPLYFQQVQLTGTVADDTDVATRGQRMKLGNISIGGKKLPGQVFATVSGADAARRSDVVTVEGQLKPGFGGFTATITGKSKGVERPVPGDVPLEVRDTFAGQVRQAITEPAASLGIGYLLGQKSALPADLVEALKITGLTHVVVASGYNLTILVRLGRRLFAKVSKYLSMLSGASLIVLFIAITGLSPSMTRAGLVAGLGLWAWYYGRKFHPVTLLGVAAAVTVAVNPSYVWGDLGWLLSFAAFAGVMILAPIATAYLYGKEKVPFVGQLLIETVSAQIVTLPIMIMAFQQFSIIAPLANLLILPIIPFIMLLTAIAGFATWLIPPLAGIAGWIPEQLLRLQVAIIDWCANIPWALEKPSWEWWGVAAYVVVVAAATAYMKYRSKYKLYNASLVE